MKGRRERELDEELRSHIRMAVADRVSRGESPEQARAAVLREFGSLALAAEDTRHVWGGQWVEHSVYDLRHAARSLVRTPVFALSAILSLAIGIGASTGLFSVLHHVALRPLPYQEPNQLAIIWNLDPRVTNPQSPASYPDWQDWRQQATDFAEISAFRNRPAFLRGGNNSLQVELHEVSADFLPLLRVPPAAGRFWSNVDNDRGDAVVISHHLWQQQFGGAFDVVGRRIVINQAPYEIVGVMPAGFRSPSMATQFDVRLSPPDSVWVPLVPRPVQKNNRGNRGLRILARLKDGASLATAQSNLAQLASRLAESYPDSNRNISVQVVPLADSVTGSARPALLALMAASVLFLLIACANVASLLLARGSGRAREFSTRAALGAGRARLIRQLLTESLLLASLGGAAGIGLAAAGLHIARQASAALDVPRLEEVALDWRGFLLAVALSTGAALLFGVLPALRLTRLVHDRGATADARGLRIRQALIAGITAVTVILLFSASLLLQSLRVLTANQDTAAARTYNFQTTLAGTPWARPPLDRQFCETLLQRLRHLPGVESAGLTTNLMQIGDNSGTTVSIEGATPLPPEKQPIVTYTMSDAAFFPMAGLQLLRGRLFDSGDLPTAPAVAIVNEAFIRSVSPDAPLLGRRVRLLGVTETSLTVIGVISDAKPFRLGGLERPRIFYPYSQFASTRVIAMVRMASGVAIPTQAIRLILRDLEPSAPLFEIQTSAGLLERATSSARWGSVVLGGFALMAVLLATLGVMGVVSFVAGQRTRECGIRIALGSTPAALQWLIARQGLGPAALGLIAGAACADSAIHAVSTYLLAIPSGRASLLSADVLLLGAAAAIAVYLPARRASRVDPSLTLRCE